MGLELKDMVAKLQPDTKAADTAPNPELYRPFRQELLEATGGNHREAEKLGKMIMQSGVFNEFCPKGIVTTDIGPVRIDSLFPGIALIENRDTPFLNGLESRPQYNATDYNVRIVEEDAGTDILSFFNLDGSMPAAYYATLDARYNTIGFLGQSLQVSWMTQNLGLMSPYNRNEDADQLARAMNRIRRSKNQYLWENTRNSNEALPSVPQPGGFSTRSTANVAAITGNLTDAIITGMVNQLATYFGYSQLKGRLVLQVPRSQLAVIRNLLITRFPGTTAITNMEFTNLLKGQVSDYNFNGYPIDFIYQDDNGMIIPVFCDDQAPAQTAIMWIADMPVLAGLSFRGSTGPHLVQLPIASFTSYVVVFDGFSLIDPLIVSRVKRTGVGS